MARCPSGRPPGGSFAWGIPCRHASRGDRMSGSTSVFLPVSSSTGLCCVFFQRLTLLMVSGQRICRVDEGLRFLYGDLCVPRCLSPINQHWLNTGVKNGSLLC